MNKSIASISGAFVLALTIPAHANPVVTLPEITITAPSHKPVHATPSPTARPLIRGNCYTRVNVDDGTRVRICESVKPSK